MSNRAKIQSLGAQREALRNEVDDLHRQIWGLSEVSVRQDAIIKNRDKTISVLTDQLKMLQDFLKTQPATISSLNTGLSEDSLKELRERFGGGLIGPKVARQ